MMRRHLVAAVILVTAAVGQAQEKPSVLPKHTVAKNTQLPRGRRIEVHVTNADLTKAQCQQLIAHYRTSAAPDGQVTVRKPAKALGGELYPWCVENFDGKGVQFNDYGFK